MSHDAPQPPAEPGSADVLAKKVFILILIGAATYIGCVVLFVL